MDGFRISVLDLLEAHAVRSFHNPKEAIMWAKRLTQSPVYKNSISTCSYNFELVAVLHEDDDLLKAWLGFVWSAEQLQEVFVARQLLGQLQVSRKK